MLAFDVNLLTNKLQKQSLDESASLPASNIKLINPDGGLKLSESAQAKLRAANSGKKVWTMSLNSESGDKDTDDRCSLPQAHGVKPAHFKPLCNHKKPVPCCRLCDNAIVSGRVFTERAKKRHCRSICVPQETETNIPPAKSSWQPQGSGLWKPIAMMTKRNCSRAGLDGKFDVRTVRWSPTECRNYEFSSLAPSVQRHMETGHITPDDLLTPPESPVPRPNSVYSDGAISPFSGEAYVDYSFNRVHYIQEFRNRSLSVEDKISFTGQSLTGLSGSESMVNMPGHDGSVPLSPHRYRVPRCRSQPTFYDRKSGRRRRRDMRPTLNFHKMTETAYGLPRRSDNLLTPNKERQGCRFHADVEHHSTCLTTIASSPHDSDTLAQRYNNERLHGNAPIHEVNICDTLNWEKEDGGGNSCEAPVRLLGDDDDGQTDMEVFQLTEELDLEQIENH